MLDCYHYFNCNNCFLYLSLNKANIFNRKYGSSKYGNLSKYAYQAWGFFEPWLVQITVVTVTGMPQTIVFTFYLYHYFQAMIFVSDLSGPYCRNIWKHVHSKQSNLILNNFPLTATPYSMQWLSGGTIGSKKLRTWPYRLPHLVM